MTDYPLGGSGQSRRKVTWLVLVWTIAVVAAACGASETASPSASISPGQTGGTGTPSPQPSRWPGPVVLAVIKLAGADGEIAKAGQDFTAAANASDLAALWGAADGLIPVIKDLIPSVDPLEQWDRTRELGGDLRTAYPLMLDGATELRDAITAGDAKGVEAGSRKLVAGLTAYSPARVILGNLVQEAILQQRVYNL